MGYGRASPGIKPWLQVRDGWDGRIAWVRNADPVDVCVKLVLVRRKRKDLIGNAAVMQAMARKCWVDGDITMLDGIAVSYGPNTQDRAPKNQ